MTRQEPCGWEPEAPCNSGPCCADVDAFPTEKALAEKIAANLLWRLTGMRFSCCDIEVRPCALGSCCTTSLNDVIYSDQSLMGGGNMGVYSFTPTLVDGQPYNLKCGVCGDGCCTCCPDCHIKLPGPVCEITDVIVNGRSLGKNQYHLYTDGMLAFDEVGQTFVLPTVSTPLLAPLTLVAPQPLTPVSSPQGDSLELTNNGASYQFNFGTNNPQDGHQDVQWIMEMPIGGSHSFDVFQPQGFDVTVLAGGNPTVTVAGSLVTVGAPTIPNSTVRLLFRAPKAATTVSDIIIQQVSGSPIRIAEISWTDLSAGPGGCPTNRTVTGPVYIPTELRFEGGDNVPLGSQGVSFDVTPTAFVAVNDGFGNYTAVSTTTPMSFTMPALHTYGVQAQKASNATIGGTNVFSAGGVDISWPVVATVTGPVTSNTNSAGYYAVLTPLGLGTGALSATGPSAAVGDNVFQYSIEWFQTVKNGANCQDFSKKNGEVGTWSVKYTTGEPVPEELNFAAGLYACELAKSMVGDKSCVLPERVQSVARPGMQIAFVDPILLAMEGLTGIPVIDGIIRALNPYKLRQVSAVWSPDLPKFRREIL